MLIVAVVGPLVYCAGWGTAWAGQEAASLGACVQGHPVQFPALVLVSGVLAVAGGLVFRHLHLDQSREQERRERHLERRVEQATARAGRRSPDPDADGGSESRAPSEIEIDTDLDLGSEDDGDEQEHAGGGDDETLMDYVDTGEGEGLQRSGDQKRSREDLDYYVPPGLEDAPELYVDADRTGPPVDDIDDRIDNPEAAYGDLEAALRGAFRLVTERSTAVVVRVMPGVYECGVEIPSRVTVVNHRLPLYGTVDERLDWLRAQDEIDHPERVTLLAPEDADVGVRMVPGDNQGIFGCVLAGRQGVAQTGLAARDNAALAVVHCAFESFRGSGAKVVDCGEDLPGRRVQFIGCLWRGNSAPQAGGGLTLKGGAARIEASIFENNRAPRGGAMDVSKMDKPLIVERCLLQRNRAIEPDDETNPRNLAIDRWFEAQGVGGAVVARRALVKFVDTIVEGNDGAVGGGGIAAVGSRVIYESTGEGRGVCRENRAGAGGGMLAVGGPQAASMIRIRGAEVLKNRGTSVGGGAAVVGNGMLDARQTVFENNHADGGQRAIGGGLAGWRGGSIQLNGGEVVSNGASASGGGIAVYNGSLRLAEQCMVNRNTAERGGGGGVFVVTGTDPKLDELIGESGFSLPLKLVVEDVRITSNNAGGPGGGLRAGNLVEKTAYPLVVDIGRPNWIADNETSSDRRHCQNIWIQWGGEMKASDATTGTIELRLE